MLVTHGNRSKLTLQPSAMRNFFALVTWNVSGLIRFMRSLFKRFAPARKVPSESIASPKHSAALVRATSKPVTISVPRRRDGAAIVAYYPDNPLETLRRAADQKRLRPYYRFKLYPGESYVEIVSRREFGKLFSKR